MRSRNTFGFTLAALAAAAMVQHASATLIVQDRLSDGDRTDSESLEAAFLSVGGSTTSVADDTGGLNDGNAVDVDVVSFHGAAAIFDTNPAGGFDSVTPLIGESLEMRFTFRFTTMDDVNSRVFRFGILNNGGDQQTVDNEAGTVDTNTVGFGAEIGVTGGSGRYIIDTNTGGGDGNMLGGATLGTAGDLGFSAIDDLTTHEIVYRLTRTSETGYTATVELDGTASPNGPHVFSNPVNVFHQFGWISGDSANDFRIDHVELDRNILRNGTFDRGAIITSGDAAGAFDDFDRHWTNTNTVAVTHTGLAGESATAAFMAGTTGGALTQAVSSDANFMFDVDFAAADASGSDRSFNMVLSNKGGGQINLRVNTSGQIQVFDGIPGSGGAWQTIGDLENITFSDDADGDLDFTSVGDTLNVWHLTIVGHDYGTAGADYDLILFPLLDPNDVRTVTGLTFWQDDAPTDAGQNGVDEVVFTTVNGNKTVDHSFAVDNVSLINLAVEVIPTPAALPAGLMLMTALAARRRR